MTEFVEYWDNAASLKNPFIPLVGSMSTTRGGCPIEDYQEELFSSNGIEIIKPIDRLSKKVRDVLRQNGVKRFQEFKQEFLASFQTK